MTKNRGCVKDVMYDAPRLFEPQKFFPTPDIDRDSGATYPVLQSGSSYHPRSLSSHLEGCARHKGPAGSLSWPRMSRLFSAGNTRLTNATWAGAWFGPSKTSELWSPWSLYRAVSDLKRKIVRLAASVSLASEVRRACANADRISSGHTIVVYKRALLLPVKLPAKLVPPRALEPLAKISSVLQVHVILLQIEGETLRIA